MTVKKPCRACIVSADGDRIKDFESLTDCARYFDIMPSDLAKRLRGRGFTRLERPYGHATITVI